MKPKAKKDLNFKYTRIGSQIIMPLATWQRIVSYLRKHGIESKEITNRRKAS